MIEAFSTFMNEFHRRAIGWDIECFREAIVGTETHEIKAWHPPNDFMKIDCSPLIVAVSKLLYDCPKTI